MRVADRPVALQANGSRDIQQDFFEIGENVSAEADIFGLFDGWGDHGSVIAAGAARIVRDAAEIDFSHMPPEFNYMAAHVGQCIRAYSGRVLDTARGRADYSGTFVTAASVRKDPKHGDGIEIAYLGDIAAYFVPTHKSHGAVRINKPHNEDDIEEFGRAVTKGGILLNVQRPDAVGNLWFNREGESSGPGTEGTRSIGGFALKYMSDKIAYAVLSLQESGILVMATRGLFVGGIMTREQERLIRAGRMDQETVEKMAAANYANGTMLLAPIA